MSHRYRQPKKSTYTGSPWAIDPSAFNPAASFMVNPMAAAMMNTYVQSALGAYGGAPGAMFNRNVGFRRDFDGGSSHYQRNQSSYYLGNKSRSVQGSSGRSGYRGGGGRHNSTTGGGRRDGRSKRPTEEAPEKPASGKKAKALEPYNPEEPTPEEDDDDDDDPEDEDTHMKSNDSQEEKSSKFGANAPSQDWKKDRDSHYCTVCELDFSGSFLIHRRTKEHRRQRDKKFPRCRLCRKIFHGVKEFEEHGKSEEHKKKCEDLRALKEKQLIQAALSDSEDEEAALKRYVRSQGQEKISDEDVEPVGQFHVVPLKAFFCKLCQKFFCNYTDGREIHCQTPDHVQKHKEHNEGKEARAVERNRLRQAEKQQRKDKEDALDSEEHMGEEEEEQEGEEKREALDEEASEDNHGEEKDPSEAPGAEDEEQGPVEEDGEPEDEEKEYAEDEAESGGGGGEDGEQEEKHETGDE